MTHFAASPIQSGISSRPGSPAPREVKATIEAEQRFRNLQNAIDAKRNDSHARFVDNVLDLQGRVSGLGRDANGAARALSNLARGATNKALIAAALLRDGAKASATSFVSDLGGGANLQPERGAPIRATASCAGVADGVSSGPGGQAPRDPHNQHNQQGQAFASFIPSVTDAGPSLYDDGSDVPPAASMQESDPSPPPVLIAVPGLPPPSSSSAPQSLAPAYPAASSSAPQSLAPAYPAAVRTAGSKVPVAPSPQPCLEAPPTKSDARRAAMLAALVSSSTAVAEQEREAREIAEANVTHLLEAIAALASFVGVDVPLTLEESVAADAGLALVEGITDAVERLHQSADGAIQDANTARAELESAVEAAQRLGEAVDTSSSQIDRMDRRVADLEVQLVQKSADLEATRSAILEAKQAHARSDAQWRSREDGLLAAHGPELLALRRKCNEISAAATSREEAVIAERTSILFQLQKERKAHEECQAALRRAQKDIVSLRESAACAARDYAASLKTIQNNLPSFSTPNPLTNPMSLPADIPPRPQSSITMGLPDSSSLAETLRQARRLEILIDKDKPLYCNQIHQHGVSNYAPFGDAICNADPPICSPRVSSAHADVVPCFHDDCFSCNLEQETEMLGASVAELVASGRELAGTQQQLVDAVSSISADVAQKSAQNDALRRLSSILQDTLNWSVEAISALCDDNVALRSRLSGQPGVRSCTPDRLPSRRTTPRAALRTALVRSASPARRSSLRRFSSKGDVKK